MTQEEKELLIKDLSARLPYRVVCVGITYDLDDDGEEYIAVKVKNTLTEIHNYNLETAYVRLGLISSCRLETVKPYLRPMSSMTEEEKKIMRSCGFELIPYDTGYTGFANIENCIDEVSFRFMEEFLNSHHFDYRGLIPMGLALEAPEGMYKT